MKDGCQLGPYAEQFRGYLLEQAPFPSNAVLSLAVLEPSGHGENPYTCVTFPKSMRAEDAWLHGFMVCGLAFRCFVGRSLRPQLRKLSLTGEASALYIAILPANQCADFLGVAEVVAAATPRGKLARTRRPGAR